MVYLRVTGIVNTTGNGNLQDFTSYYINFLISYFENLVISVISNKISGGAYETWQQLVSPCIYTHIFEGGYIRQITIQPLCDMPSSNIH